MMRKLLSKGFALSLAFTSTMAGATDKLFYPLKAPVEQSVLFFSVKDQKVLTQEGADKLLIPASVTKLITSAAALSAFSPKHTFQTRTYYSGSRAQDVIKGDLFIVGDGDPFLVSEKLWQFAADVRHLGIRKITGDIVIDNSLFDDMIRDAPRASSEAVSDHAYDAPVTALGINFNTMGVAMAPALTVGNIAIAELDPYDIPGVTVRNTLKTVQNGKSIHVTRQSQKGSDANLIVTGNIALGQKMIRLYRSVENPVKVSGELIRAFLAKEGIQVEGSVREGVVPKSATSLVNVESFDVAYIVKGLNHFSNNYIADVMQKRLAAAFPEKGEPDRPGSGTMAGGSFVLSRFLKEDVGVKDPFSILNASGLDPKNRLTARQLVAVLSYMETRFDLFPDFLASLPAAGWGGTLARRFNGSTRELEGIVRAKTGTLSSPVSVSSLAGYLRHPRHGLVAFAIIENGLAGKAQPGILELRKRQEQALKNFMQSR